MHATCQEKMKFPFNGVHLKKVKNREDNSCLSVKQQHKDTAFGSKGARAENSSRLGNWVRDVCLTCC